MLTLVQDIRFDIQKAMALVCLHCPSKAIDPGSDIGGARCTRRSYPGRCTKEEVMFCKYGAMTHKKRKDCCYCSTCVSNSGGWATRLNNALANGNMAYPCEYCMSQGGTLTKIDNVWIADTHVTYSTAHVHQAAPAPPTVAPMALTNVPHNQAAPDPVHVQDPWATALARPAPPVPPGMSLPANGAASSHDVPEPIDSSDESDRGASARKEVETLKMKLECQRQLLDSALERENHQQQQILFLRGEVTSKLKAITTDHHQLLDAMKAISSEHHQLLDAMKAISSEVQKAMSDDRQQRQRSASWKRRSRSESASSWKRQSRGSS